MNNKHIDIFCGLLLDGEIREKTCEWLLEPPWFFRNLTKKWLYYFVSTLYSVNSTMKMTNVILTALALERVTKHQLVKSPFQ